MKSKLQKSAVAMLFVVMTLAVTTSVIGCPFYDGSPAAVRDEAATAYQRAYELILSEQWDKAIQAFQGVMKQFPKSSAVDDAAFYVCLARDKSGKKEEALKCYGQFIGKYPLSTYVDEAKENLTMIAHDIGRTNPEVEIRIDPSDDKDFDVRVLALQALIDSDGAEQAYPVIIKFYDKTTNPRNKEKILYVLNEIELPEVTVKLSEIVQKDPSLELRKKAVYALGDREGNAAIEELKKIVKSKNDLEIRKAALFSLADTDDPNVVTFLGGIASTETNIELAKAATFAIGDTESPEASKALQAILKSSAILEVRKAALHTLADQEIMSVGTLKEVALMDQNEELRRTAVYALADVENPEALAALKEILASSKDPKIQESSLHALADHGGKLVSDILMATAINNPEERLARTAVHALGDATEGDTSLLLEVFRKSKFQEVRKAALYSIGDHGGKSGFDSLARILKEEKEEEYRIVALHAIAETNQDEAVVPILLNVARNDPSQRVRTIAVQMLGEIGTPAAKKALMEILEKE